MLIKDTSLATLADEDYREEAGSRRVAACLLRYASRALDRLAERLAMDAKEPAGPGVVEFHADAGAPEGALYIDGQLVGHVLGVRRL